MSTWHHCLPAAALLFFIFVTGHVIGVSLDSIPDQYHAKSQRSEIKSRRAIVDQHYSSNYCSFTADTCGWVFTKSNYYSIGRTQKSTVSSTGPDRDRTLGVRDKGYYIGLNSNFLVTRSNVLIGSAKSPTFPPADDYCLMFWYSMYGADLAGVSVNAEVDGGIGYPIRTLRQESDPQWRLAAVHLDSEYSYSGFQVVFQFVVPPKSYYKIQKAEAAIDDIYVYNTTCCNIPRHPKTNYIHKAGNMTSYYQFYVKAMTWQEASVFCRKQSPWSGLVSIETEEEQKYLVRIIKSDPVLTSAGASSGFYTSGNDIDTEHTFRWSGTSAYLKVRDTYNNWKTGQPNNVGGHQECLAMQYSADNYSWGDISCDKKLPFICEVAIPDVDPHSHLG